MKVTNSNLLNLIVVVTVFSAEASFGVTHAHPSPDEDWKRPLPEKQEITRLTENHVPGLIRLKIVDDYPAFSENGRIKSLNESVPASLKVLQSLLIDATIEPKIKIERSLLKEWRETAMRNLGREAADLSQWYIVQVPSKIDVADLINRLNKLDIVEIALPVLKAPPPPSYCQTNSCISEQGYLFSPPGINAQAMWTQQGVIGQNVRVALLEYAFGYHNDVPNPIVLNTAENLGTNSSHDDAPHGTATYGIMGGTDNAYGITGIAYGSTYYFGSTLSWYSQGGYFYQDICPILTQAKSALQLGDVIVINNQFTDWVGSGLVPIEWDPEFYQCIKTAVGNNYNVVISAGNGASNLDSSYFNTGHKPFVLANDSGSIIAGGGKNTDLSRWNSSTYGSRVNVQGWAQNVRTTTSSPSNDYIYFGGTSSATPIVGAAVALVQSAYKAATGQVATPAQMRSALVATGSQQTGDTSKHIGPLPNVTAAAQYLTGGGAGPATPQNFSVQSWLCYGQGSAQWQAPPGGGSYSYELQASYHNYFPPSQSWLEYVGSNTTVNLNVSQTTYFRVRACAGGNCSTWTGFQSLTPLSGCY